MNNISLELVPRSIESLETDLQIVRERFPGIQMVNIPDLLRFEVRSWEGGLPAGEAKRAQGDPSRTSTDSATRSPILRTLSSVLIQPGLQRRKIFWVGTTIVLHHACDRAQIVADVDCIQARHL